MCYKIQSVVKENNKKCFFLLLLSSMNIFIAKKGSFLLVLQLKTWLSNLSVELPLRQEDV